MRFAFRCYFRKIHVLGEENIPSSGPILMLCNHPNSFTEPMLLACFQKRTLNFLVRGDVFENKFLNPILRHTYQIPIYRARDGFENLRKNKSTFEFVHQKLKQAHTVLIFPESTTHLVRYLRPLQKGAAHIAIQSVQDYEMLNLLVIPCGVNYKNVIRAGEDVLIHIGKPINISDWLKENSTVSDQAALLTELFTREMNKVVHSIPSSMSTKLYDDLSNVYIKSYDEDHLSEKHQSLIKSISIKSEELNSMSKAYVPSRSELPAIEFSLTQSNTDKLLNLLKTIGAFLLGIPALFLYGIPLLISKKIAKSLIKKDEFKPPIRIVSGIVMCKLALIGFLIYIILELGFAIGILFAYLSILSIYFLLQFIYNASLNKYLFSYTISKNKIKLLGLRQRIIDTIDDVTCHFK
ncbi:MAG: 1-acyl-sn-glycerol-3-phosphate acyltransferase [Saprospiraceae bacterium]